MIFYKNSYHKNPQYRDLQTPTVSNVKFHHKSRPNKLKHEHPVPFREKQPTGQMKTSIYK